MSAILYEAVTQEPAIEGVALVSVTLTRSGGSPSIRFVYSEGYYLKNGTEYVLNDLGYPTWVAKGRTWERTSLISDQEILGLAQKYTLDLGGLDDDLVAMANEYMDAHVFHPPVVEAGPIPGEPPTV